MQRRETSRLKTPEQHNSVVYLHVILPRMHGKGTATEKELDTVLQMTVEQSTKWTAIVTNINKCV